MLKLVDVGVTADSEHGSVQILKNVNLTLDNKKIYVMTGPNGGGKTSLAKAVMGIYKTSSGKIFLDGADITGLSITERARLGIGYAFQQPARFKGLTVGAFLKLASGPDSTVDHCSLLYDVGLCAQDYINREINASFSGGELKRIEIASILARNLKVALFDEPEAGIDLWSFQRLTETFKTLNDKYDTTIVIISHQERILRLADAVILVSNGGIEGITTQEKFLGDIVDIDNACRCRIGCVKEGKADADCSR
ncbi:ATP-binding cassette domain-containing protein [Oscillospiraceae bacterium CM]|nr:ATP-binding cassette domain-containing protein [Oscillospiraceae bacterium CM]